MLDAALRLAETTPWAMSVLGVAAVAAGVVLWRVLSEARRAARSQADGVPGGREDRIPRPGPPPATAGPSHPGPGRTAASEETTLGGGTVLRLPRLRERAAASDPGEALVESAARAGEPPRPSGSIVAARVPGAAGKPTPLHPPPDGAAAEDTLPTWLRPDARRVPPTPLVPRHAAPREPGWTAAVPGVDPAAGPLPIDAALPHLARQLAAHVVGIDPLYGLPWLLAIGPAGAGRRAALGGVPLPRPLGDPGLPGDGAPDPGLVAWVYERGIVLDVSDALLEDTVPARTAWRRLADRLRHARPDRPLDGVLLFLPAADDGTDPEVRRLLGLRLAARLATLRDRLAQVLPVYVVLAGPLPGLAAWTSGLAAGRRDGMVGWSSPRGPAEDVPGDWPAAARRAIVPPIEQSLLAAAARAPGSASGATSATDALAAALAVPGAVESRLATLAETVDPVVRRSGFAETPSLRGVYLAGVEPSAFLVDLLESKVFAEASLARPTRRARRRRAATRAALAAAIAVLLVGGGLVLARDVLRVRDDVDRLAPVAAQARRDLARLADHGGADPAAVAWRRARGADLVGAMAGLAPDPLDAPLLPPSWSGALAAEAEAAIAEALTRLALPAVPDALADAALADPPSAPPDADAPPASGAEALSTALAPLAALVARSEAVTVRARAYEAVRRASAGDDALPIDLAAAARVALGDGWAAGAGPGDAAWRRALDGADLPPFDVGRHRPALRLAAERLGDAAAERVFTQSPLLRDAEALADSLAPALAARPDAPLSRDAVAAAAAAGDALEASLARAGADALLTDDPLALPAVAALLDRVAAADMLGRTPADRIAAALRAAHGAARTRLAGLAVAPLGPLVLRTEDGLAPAPQLARLLDALDGLAPFLAPPPAPDSPVALPRHRLDPARLDAVLETVAAWRRFRGDGLDRFPQRMRPAIARLADRGLADAVLAGVADAFVPVPPGRPLDPADAAARLAAAAPTLETLGAVLQEIGAGAARARLDGWITRYTAALLEAQQRG